MKLNRSNFARPGSSDPGPKRGFGNPLRTILGPLRLVSTLAIIPERAEKGKLSLTGADYETFLWCGVDLTNVSICSMIALENGV